MTNEEVIKHWNQKKQDKQARLKQLAAGAEHDPFYKNVIAEVNAIQRQISDIFHVIEDLKDDNEDVTEIMTLHQINDLRIRNLLIQAYDAGCEKGWRQGQLSTLPD